MTKELEPCPFCGGEAMLCENLDYSYVYCMRCGCQTNEVGDILDAIEALNTRYKRTCKMVPDGYGEDSEGYIGFDCDQCGGGMIFPSDCEPSGFCCHCGAEVVDD